LKFKKFAIGAMALLALTSCAQSPNDAESAQNASNGSNTTLIVYSGRNEAFISPFFEQVTSQTGIKIEARYGDSAELAALLLEEGNNSPADVFLSQDAGAIGAVAQQNLLKKLEESAVSTVPKQFRDEASNWVGITGRSRIIAYNKTKYTLEQLPKTIDDLVDPKWSGKIAIAPTNSSFQSFVTAIVQVRGETKTLEWLKALNNNNPQKYEKNGLIVEAIDNGSVDLGLVNHYYIAEITESLGREINVDIAFFDNQDLGNLLNVSAFGILETSKKQAAALDLLKYLLSKEAQQKFVNETFEYSLLLDVNPPDGLPALGELGIPRVRLGQLSDVAKTQDLLISSGLL
jgi:iron(III) transport system substrate-binding protein